jgi:hypothetical protein
LCRSTRIAIGCDTPARASIVAMTPLERKQ